ncbi:VOC family protein [Streptomyces hesseae]|uniref:VOC family protein n=1 Tax=Streptomyces hesseae TaxID=3075519 RepID=A0ABU2SNZ0_9ACTN|nr:VOC family protein [Streptomyces sp. DSM 40473]MDT0450703.1 VOC family protein [Streptomyces sp. DSM 40473]
MANELNHIIVHVKDRRETAAFVAGLMAAEAPRDWGHFTQITSSNGVGIDFCDDLVAPDDLNPSHLAFLVTDGEFDAILARITERGLPYFPDPLMRAEVEGTINHEYGGRGLYLRDPGGTVALEFMTTPYGEEWTERPTRRSEV